MKRLTNITDEPIQRHTILFNDELITLIIRFMPVVQIWTISFTYKEQNYNGIKLSLGTLHIDNFNLPFDFLVTDNSATDLDPFQNEDFANKRNFLYFLEADDMETIRGYPVEL